MLKIKLCGLTDIANIREADALDVMMLGFIFYPKSKRYVGSSFSVPQGLSAKKTGVFVDASVAEIERIVNENQLNAIQLHGHESPTMCKSLKREDLMVIKAFGIDHYFDFKIVEPYLSVVDLFLFDTATAGKGGSGKKFDWHLLEKYTYEKPFLLSGGIGPEDAGLVNAFRHTSLRHLVSSCVPDEKGLSPCHPSLLHPSLYGIDLNSRFEDQPGIKNIEQLKQFINTLNHAK